MLESLVNNLASAEEDLIYLFPEHSLFRVGPGNSVVLELTIAIFDRYI